MMNRWEEDEKWKIKLGNLYIPDHVDSEKFLKKLKIRYYNENVEKYEPKTTESTNYTHVHENSTTKNNEKFYIITSLTVNFYIFVLSIFTFFSPNLYRNTVITAALNFFVSYIRTNGVLKKKNIFNTTSSIQEFFINYQKI